MGQDPDEIRRQIEETRSRMTDTVDAIGYKTDVRSRAKESIDNTRERIVESITDAKNRVKESVVGAGDAMSEAGSSAVGSVAGAATSARDAMGNVASGIAEATPDTQQLKQGTRRAVGVAQENPIGLAVGGIALGFLAGMMIPTSRREEQTLGPMAHQIREKAVETGHQVIDKAVDTANSAVETAASNAASSVLQDVTQQAADKAHDVLPDR